MLLVLVAMVLFAVRKFMDSANAPVRVDPSRAPFKLRDAQGIVASTIDYSDRVCFVLPGLPARRRYPATQRPVPAAPPAGVRRPTLQDLVDAGLARRTVDFETVGEQILTVETVSIDRALAADYKRVRDVEGQLCFARVKLAKMLAVDPDVAGPSDVSVRYTLEVVQVQDWVRQLPAEVAAQTAPWLRQQFVESRMHLCHRNGGTTGGTCAGAEVDDDPPRLLRTGPQPEDGLGPWLSPGMRGY